MSKLRHGRIERAIIVAIARATSPEGAGTIRITPSDLAHKAYRSGTEPEEGPMGEPTLPQRKAVIRAMHSFVRKYPRFVLLGGEGRGRLLIFDGADPISAMWAKLTAERKSGRFIRREDAIKALELERGAA